MDMRFDTVNVGILYRTISLMTVAIELSKYKLGLVRVQGVRWDRGSNEPTGGCTFLFEKGNENREFGYRFLYA
jgi:hypothetical protein